MQLPTKLAQQLQAVRADAKQSRLQLAAHAGLDRATIAALETGNGTLASLRRVAEALGYYVTPWPSALANKRKWLGIGTRSLAKAADITRPTLQALERSGAGRVCTFEAVCSALGETAKLRPLEATWSTPETLVLAVLNGLAIKRFCLDPCSPHQPTIPCAHHFTERDGSLWLPWRGNYIWCNPPYDQMPAFTAKMLEEFADGRAHRIISLIPYEPRTASWRATIDSAAVILILEKRLKFGGRASTLGSPSAFALWGFAVSEVERLSTALPAHHRAVFSRNARDQAGV